MLPRNVPDSIKKATPDELDTSSRRYFLKLVDHTKALNSSKPSDDDNTIRGDCIDGIRLPTTITPRDIFNLREHLKPRQDDVFIVTFPKCGTTWMQQIVKLIWNKGEEDGRDIDAALPWVDPMTPEEIEVLPSPRGFKTHLPYHLCPGGDPCQSPAKYIYVYRNPKDAVVSNYHFSIKFFPEDVSWDDYFKMMMIDGDVYYGHILDHVKGWYIKDAPNILPISYESLKRNPVRAITTVSTFLGNDHSEEIIQKIVEATCFDKMKSNSLANNSWMDLYRREGSAFMRKGEIGDWKTLFNEEQSSLVDAMVVKKLSGTNLSYDYGD